MVSRTTLIAVALLCTGFSTPFVASVSGQAAPAGEPAARTAVVTATSDPINVDGVLDEPIWSSAPKIGALVQRQPRAGDAPTERTDITLLHDASHLYIGVIAYDSEPARVIGTQMARDASLSSDDRVEILLDTFQDQRNAFYFATNPSGALVDGLVADGVLNGDWDAIWNVRTRRTDQGWTAEFAIPFKSLNFPVDRTVWGFNVARTVYRKLEDQRWSGARFQTQFYQLSEAGEIAHPRTFTQGRGLDLRPFLGGSWLHLGSTSSDAFTGKPGLDAFYNITPSLKLTATLNTDFGETEVDARQINLQRFAVTFPEKRSFFLEGVGVFAFASAGPTPAAGMPSAGADIYPFFSRRIGLLSGQEVPLDAGIKLTGTVGRTDLGVLSVRSGDLEDVVDARNLFVGRVKRNLFQQSYIGAVFTEGDPGTARSSRTIGADVRLATSRFLGGRRNFNVNAFALRSVNEGVSDRDWSYGLAVEYPNDKYAAHFALREIQENFQPALGFVQRDNVRMMRAAFSYNPRPRFWNMQQIFHDFYFTQFRRLDNKEIESWDFYATILDWHTRSGDNWHGLLDVNVIYERLFEPFQLSPGVLLQPGEYRFTRFKSNPFTTATRRRVSGNLTINWGNYWSGTAEQIQAGITVRAAPKFQFSFSSNQTFAHLPEGNFTARIFTSNINYSTSPFLSFSNLIQYDNRSRNLGWQSRIRWTLEPGSDLFFAFNQGWVHDDPDKIHFRPQDTKLSAKAQFTRRF